MAVTAPSFISEAESSWTTNNPASQEKSLAVTAGDWIVVSGIDEAAAGTLALAIEGGGLTWEQKLLEKAASGVYAIAWAAKATSTTTITIKVKASGIHEFGSIGRWGFNALLFRGSEGIGEVKVARGSGEPSMAITTKQENSALVVFNGDFAAKVGTTRTWRTGAGAFTEQTFAEASGAYGVYGGFHASAAAAGAKTVGLTKPTGQTYTIFAVEVKGTTTGGEKTEALAAVALVKDIGNAAAPKRTQAASVGVDRAIGLAAITKRSQAAAVGVDRAFGAAPGSTRLQLAAVGVLRSIAATPVGKQLGSAAVALLTARTMAGTAKRSQTAAVGPLRAAGGVPGTIGRLTALVAQMRSQGLAPTPKRSQAAAVGVLKALGAVAGAVRTSSAAPASITVLAAAPGSRRRAIADAVSTRFRALNPGPLVIGIPALTLPLTALISKLVNSALFRADKNTATFTSSSNSAEFDKSVNSATLEAHTTAAEIEDDTNTATIGS